MEYDGPDRRENPTQASLIKLLAKVESMEYNIEVKQQAIIDKIINIDEKLATRIQNIESKLDAHIAGDDEINEVLEIHDDKLRMAEPYVDRIKSLETKYNILETRTQKLEDAPKLLAFNIAKGVLQKAGWALLGALGLMVLYVMLRPNILQEIFAK